VTDSRGSSPLYASRGRTELTPTAGSAPKLASPASRAACVRQIESSLFVKKARRVISGQWSAGPWRGAGRVVVVLVRVRERLVRRAGVAGCEPAALDGESFPACPPGPSTAAWRASVSRAE
jgi:hypothetical protein